MLGFSFCLPQSGGSPNSLVSRKRTFLKRPLSKRPLSEPDKLGHSHTLDGQDRQLPLASVQRTRSTLAGHSATPRGTLLLGSSQTWLFQTWVFAILTRKCSFAQVCALLRSFCNLRPFALFLQICICALLRSFCRFAFALFCAHLRVSVSDRV